MDQYLLAQACILYRTNPAYLQPLAGGHYNAVYQFPLNLATRDSKTNKVTGNDEFAIMRIGLEDCPPGQTLSMLEWVDFLAGQGAPVNAPLPSINAHLMERLEYKNSYYTLTAFKKATGILAENIPPEDWSTDLFQAIGKAVGKFHYISTNFQPSHPSFSRPHWFDSYEILEANEKLIDKNEQALEKLVKLIHELRQLPTSPIDFGLIHDDLHFANFLIQPGGQVTIVDFDDCVYGWFAMDIAMALFDVLVLYNALTDGENQLFAHTFLSSYLSGYRQEHDLPLFWQRQIPNFLKLKELCIYADLLGHPDIALADTWVGRFMRDRSRRITHEIPYVNIDFSDL